VDAFVSGPVVRAALLSVAFLAVGIALFSLLFGPVRFELPGVGVVRSSGIFRPIVVAVIMGALAGAMRRITHAVIVVLVISLLPFPAYRRSLVRLTEANDRLRSARDCLQSVQARVSGPGLHVDAPPAAISHPLYYYLRQVRPWSRVDPSDPELLDRYLHDSSEVRPILVWEPTYQRFWYGVDTPGDSPSTHRASPSMIVFKDIGSNTFLLLPGPYAVCSAETRKS
jgi:hypothetical protein